jgi:Fe-S cluster assembly protein SufD
MTATLSHSHGAPTGSPAERFTSRNPDDFDVPRGREEEWRFAPVRRLRAFFEPSTDEGTVKARWEAPAGATVELTGRDHPLFGSALTPADRASALAFANVQHVLVVTIAAEAQLDEPVWITIDGTPGFNYGHVIIDAKPYSKATVILDHVGSATVSANVESIAADGATLTVVSVQDWADDALHLSAQANKVGRDARINHTVVNLGGSIVRINPTVQFAGPGGEAELYGISFAGQGQHLESRLYVDHSQPNCTSHVVYKSALDGDTARTVWIGDVRIRPTATGTTTYELNRNLLLSDGARADSVPNLEIETGEIAGAGHASATGRFDDLHLFYLQSRGISEDEARRLVVRGFFADVVNHITVPALHDRLMAAIDARLGFTAELETE